MAVTELDIPTVQCSGCSNPIKPLKMQFQRKKGKLTGMMECACVCPGCHTMTEVTIPIPPRVPRFKEPEECTSSAPPAEQEAPTTP